MTNIKTKVSDFGIHCVNVNVSEWPLVKSLPELHAIATAKGKEYLSENFPGLIFTEETGLMGAYHGALIYGVAHTFRVQEVR